MRCRAGGIPGSRSFTPTPNPCPEGFGRGPGAGLIRGVVCCCDAARGFADYPPSAGFTALPIMFRALGALTFWQVAPERMLGANSSSRSIGSARYRPSGPVLSVPADQKFPDHEISVWTDKAPNCYFEISGYNRAKVPLRAQSRANHCGFAWFPKFVAAENSSVVFRPSGARRLLGTG